jgi:hypothetical protein
MDHPSFLANRAADLNEFRKARIGPRARSFTFGEGSISKSTNPWSTGAGGAPGSKAHHNGPSKSVTTATAIVEEGEHDGQSGDSSFDSPAGGDSPCPPGRPGNAAGGSKVRGGSWGRHRLERAATALDFR